MIEEQVRKLAYNLKLLGIHESFQRHADEAASHGLHPNEFLKLVLEEEVLYRKNRKANTLLTRAQFRSHADIEDWDTSFDRGLNKSALRGLARLNFFHNKENLILLGATGRGKTHLATALGRQLCQAGYSTQFISVNLLFEEVQAYRASGKYLWYLKKLSKLDALILDDFALRSYTHSEATFLVDLLEFRMQKGIQIITSQVDPKGWKALFEDPVVADAIIDRAINPSTSYIIKGESYRKNKKSLNRSDET